MVTYNDVLRTMTEPLKDETLTRNEAVDVELTLTRRDIDELKEDVPMASIEERDGEDVLNSTPINEGKRNVLIAGDGSEYEIESSEPDT